MKKLFLMIFLAGSLLISMAQTPEVNSIARNVTDFSLDNYGNLYAISGNSLVKYDSNGEKQASFTRFEWGEISSVNVQNPMKIMLFYQESGIIVFLDENLNPLSEELNLFDNQYNTISLAAYSTANKIYLFDPVNQDLIILDFYLREISRNHFSYSDISPVRMSVVKESFVALQDVDQGVFLFDAFGNFDRKIGVITQSPIHFRDSEITYYQDGKFFRYNFQTLQNEEKSMPLPVAKVKKLQQTSQRIYLLDEGGELLSMPAF